MSARELQVETIQAFKKFYSRRHLFGNVLLTGSKSAAFRAVGFLMVKQWEKDNHWYYDTLASGPASELYRKYAQSFRRSIETFKLCKFRYIFKEKLIDMEISQNDGQYTVGLQGFLNKYTLREVLKTFKQTVSGNYQDMVIKLDGVTFSSEKIVRNFLCGLNELAGKSKNITVKIPFDRMVFQGVWEKYRLGIPNFELAPQVFQR
jgi:hypothetical protein